MDIKKIRKDLKLSQEDFAKLIGVHRHTVIKYEKGEPIPENKAAFIKTLVEKLTKGDSTNLDEIFAGQVAEPNLTYMTAIEKDKYIESLERIIESKDGQILALQEQIAFLKEMIKQ